MSKRYAVIDVGTNTVRLLVAEQVEGRLVPAHTDKELVRLGRDLAHDGRISDESLLHVSDALRRYAGVARKLGASDLRIIATSAAREAENGQELAARVLADTGHELEIIDEDEEARLAWVGALNALDEPWEGEVGVVDVGGGSTEVVVGSIGNGIHFSHSYRLGSGRLTDLCIEHDPPRPFELERVRRIIDETLPPVGEIPQPQHAVRRRRIGQQPAPPRRPAARRRGARARRAHPLRAPVATHRAALRARARARAHHARGRADPACLRGPPGRAAVVLQGRYPRGGRARDGRRAPRTQGLMAPGSSVELDPGEPLRTAARRVVAARAGDLAGIVPGAVGASDPEALHDVRVAVRRLTSALDVFADGLEEEPRRRARRMLRRDAEPLGARPRPRRADRARPASSSSRRARASRPAWRTCWSCSRASAPRPRPTWHPPSRRSPTPSLQAALAEVSAE